MGGGAGFGNSFLNGGFPGVSNADGMDFFKVMSGDRARARAFFKNGLAEKSPAEKIFLMILESSLSDDRTAKFEKLVDTPGFLPDFAHPAFGVTPLMAAAACNQPQMVRKLARHLLTDINRQDSNGCTALHYAAAAAHLDGGDFTVLEELLAHKADPAIRNIAGKTALDVAATSSMADVFNAYAPKKNPAVAPVPAPATAEAASAIDPKKPIAAQIADEEHDVLKKFMFDLAAKGGDGGTSGTFYNLFWRLKKFIPQMRPGEFEEMHAAFRGKIKVEEWDQFFIEAARHGRLDILEHLSASWKMPNPRVLDPALKAALEGGDFPVLVQRLLAWGASPNAKAEGGGHVYDIGFEKKRRASLQQICIWTPKLKGFKEFQDAGMESANALYARKRELVGKGRDAVAKAFYDAIFLRQVDNAEAQMLYAASREVAGFFKDPAELKPVAAMTLVCLSLMRGEVRFAERMMADGYLISASLANTVLGMNSLSPAARKIATAIAEGTYKPASVETFSRRYTTELARIAPPMPPTRFGL